MAHQPETGGQRAAADRPTTCHHVSGYDGDIVRAQARYEELTDRGLYARSRTELEVRGEYGPARHGATTPEPLAVGERLELLAEGGVLTRYYRHPADLARAVEAGASWEQIGAARGTSADQDRQEYRDWAEGQHQIWTGELGGKPGVGDLDDDAFAAAIGRAAAGQVEPGPAGACGFGHNQPGPHGREAGQ